MGDIARGINFGAVEQVTAAKLHALVDDATVSSIVAADITDGVITNVKISDVAGNKFTNLSSIPSGAGVIPASNIPTSFVAGMIMLWSGAIVNIPAGWLLCDGTSGTPNLRDRFVVGAGSTYAVAGTGGSTTIAEANLPSHVHAAGSLTGGAHTHNIERLQGGGVTGTDSYSPADTVVTRTSRNNEGTAWADDPNASYVRAKSGGAAAVTGSTGAIGSGTGYLQPYYALAYIMKS